jgi:serine/threonine-protein kinase
MGEVLPQGEPPPDPLLWSRSEADRALRSPRENRVLTLLRSDGIIARKYRLKRELARGGMGALWVAFDLERRRSVAIKFINPAAAQRKEAHVRFEREARAAAQICSPNVIETYEYVVDEGQAFLVMELLQGEDLGVLLARERRLPLAHATRLLDQITTGLDAVHAASIIHRDMKPGNIFISLAGGEETVKLIDFGAARLESRHDVRTTAPGAIIGTLHYMAPEQTLGEATLDHRVDLWATAVIMYRLLTGERPFHGASVNELIRSICGSRITPPSVLEDSLPTSLDGFFERAFARPREDRFSSAIELSAAFKAASKSARPYKRRMATTSLRRADVLAEAATVGYQRVSG